MPIAECPFSDTYLKSEQPNNSFQSLSTIPPQSSKRFRDAVDTSGESEKRQRTDPAEAASAAEPANDDFAELLARAAAHAEASLGQRRQSQPAAAAAAAAAVSPVVAAKPAASNITFAHDPHLYMRILSLPILESLVRFPGSMYGHFIDGMG